MWPPSEIRAHQFTLNGHHDDEDDDYDHDGDEYDYDDDDDDDNLMVNIDCNWTDISSEGVCFNDQVKSVHPISSPPVRCRWKDIGNQKRVSGT